MHESGRVGKAWASTHTHTHTIHTPSGTHTDRLTDRQTDRQTDKQTHVGDHGIHCMHENVKGM